MKYMVIESFKPGKIDEVYERFRINGRILPNGLSYLDSWLTFDKKKCYQLMETNDPDQFAIWMKHWNDLIDFEIVELIDSPTKAVQ